MKNIGIVTPYGNKNFGNKLQNYALQEVLKKFDFNVVTFKNYNWSNSKKFYFLRFLKNLLFTKEEILNDRTKAFLEFNKYINYSNKIYNAYSKYDEFDYVVVGSDQVWNPDQRRLRDFDILTNVSSDKRIAYAASFGIDNIDKKYYKKLKKIFSKYKAISVREEAGKKIINDILDSIDVEVVLDPTLLLASNDWEKITKAPNKKIPSKYILCYFLGNLSSEKNKSILKYAKKNKCEIINILDSKDPFYNSGPSEFLYLEKHAHLICTDSFHSSVFAFIFNKPFVFFNRDQANLKDMNSRIETFLKSLEITDRIYNGENITASNIKYDYSKSYKLLDKERKRAYSFLKEALDVKAGDEISGE